MHRPLASTKCGKLLGTVSENVRGGNIFSFQGVPYAKPPINELRFKAPKPAEPWAGVRDASTDGAPCFSLHMMTKELVGGEDCLTLSVFTPSLAGGRPVMLWLHGGGFTSGSNSRDAYGPEYLLAEDVVLVTVNYRLGVLGFLSLNDPGLGVPGNAGLKDLVMALRWVRDNIASFGGDPHNVTIFGESAGGAAVHYLILSPMAKGLFHKAIAQSGCALNPWAQGRRSVRELAKILKLRTSDERKILQYLQKLPVKELFLAARKIPDGFFVSHTRPFGPVVERLSAEPAFLHDNPIDIIKSGLYNKVPLIMGFTNREGMLAKAYNPNDAAQLFENFELSIPHFLHLKSGSDLSIAVSNKIKQFYFGNRIDLHDTDKYYILESDNFFIRDIYNAVKYHAETASTPVYLYRMSVESELNLFKRLLGITEKGVCHADDIFYLFKSLLSPDIKPQSLEDLSVRRFTKLWCNFARYGNPNPPEQDPLINVKWKPVKRDQINFIDIGKELTADVNPEPKRMAFWDEILNINPVYCKL